MTVWCWCHIILRGTKLRGSHCLQAHLRWDIIAWQHLHLMYLKLDIHKITARNVIIWKTLCTVYKESMHCYIHFHKNTRINFNINLLWGGLRVGEQAGWRTNCPPQFLLFGPSQEVVPFPLTCSVCETMNPHTGFMWGTSILTVWLWQHVQYFWAGYVTEFRNRRRKLQFNNARNVEFTVYIWHE